jgi:hypothetical protein
LLKIAVQQQHLTVPLVRHRVFVNSGVGLKNMEVHSTARTDAHELD